MKKIAWFLSIMAISLLIPAFLYAEDRFDKGSWEIAVGSDAISLDLEPSIGYFLADNIEGIVHFDFVHRDDDLPPGFADVDTDAYFIGIEALGHLPIGAMVVPFLGVGFAYYQQEEDVAGTTVGDIDQDAFVVNGEFGIRILIGARASFNPSINVGFAEIDDNLSSVSLDRTQFGFGYSFSLFF